MNEKKVNNICFLIVLIITIIMIFFIVNNSRAIQNAYNIDKISFIFLLMIMFNFIYCFLSVLFLPILKIIEKIYINRNENYPNTIEYDYYREIINNYSVLSLAKCYSNKINYKDVFVATLLKLKIAKKIDIVNDKIVILDKENLLPSERNFIIMLENVQRNKKYPKKQMKLYLEQDFYIENKNYLLFLQKKVNLNDYITKFIGILWLINLIFLIIYGHLGVSGVLSNKIIIYSFIYHFLTLFLYLYYCSRTELMIRSEKGKELQNKLIGLRNFINGFGNINNKQVEEVYMWEYYIIYAIIFNQKGNLNNDSYKFYKKYIDKFLY